MNYFLSQLVLSVLFFALTCLNILHSIATDQMELVPKMSFAAYDVTLSLIVRATGNEKVLSEQSPQ